MRVLITGASGTIGGAIADALVARGDEVVGLSRDPERAAARAGIRWEAWDPAEEPAPAGALEGCGAVVNMVGEPIDQRLTEQAKRRIRQSRVDAGRNLVAGIERLAADVRPRVLVGQSAVGYYGDRADVELTEEAPPGSDFLAGLCRDWEAVQLRAVELGLRVAVLRTGLILARGGGVLAPMLLPFKLGLGGPLAGGDQYMPWIHIADEVGIVLLAIDDEQVSGPINATAREPVPNAVFAKALGRALNRPAFLPTPKLAVKLLYGSELADAVTESQRAIPARAQELGYEFRFRDLDEALRDVV